MKKYFAGLNEVEDFTEIKKLGTWFGSRDIEVVELDGDAVALAGWNGESYNKCFKVADPTPDGVYMELLEDLDACVYPVYEQSDEDDEEPCDYETCGYWSL